jgi:hypothetical protein
VAKKTAKLAGRRAQAQENVLDLWIETVQRMAPRSTKLLLDSGMQLLEAHREFLAERIERLERAQSRISKTASRPRARSKRVTVKTSSQRRANK